MKAAVLERRGADGVSWRDFPDPEAAEGESILRVVAGSITVSIFTCATMAPGSPTRCRR